MEYPAFQGDSSKPALQAQQKEWHILSVMSLVRARFDAARTQIFSQDSVKQFFNTQAVFLPLYPLCVSGQKRPLVETPHSFEINKTILAQLNTEFKKTFKLHCCLVGGDQKEPKRAVVTLPFLGGEWNAESVYNSIVWKSFDEATEACNEVRVCQSGSLLS